MTITNKSVVKKIVGMDTTAIFNDVRPAFFEIKNTSLGEVLDEDNRYGYQIWSYSFGYVLTDGLFNNKSISYNTSVSSIQLGYHEGQILRSRSLQIELRAITEGYYKYQRTLNLQRSAVDNPLSEPLFMYTNVKNGFGHFSGYSTVKSDRIFID